MEISCLFICHVFKMCDNDAYLNDNEDGSAERKKHN